MDNISKTKRLMILGAGTYQVPLIKKAKDMGLFVIVVSPAGYPGIHAGDVFIDSDTRNADRIISVAREFNIDGIITTGTDVCVPAMGSVIDSLGLRGSGYDVAVNSSIKSNMKRLFKEHGVSTADFGVFDQLVDANQFADNIGYPVMVKAVDSSGSRGVIKVNRKEELSVAWDNARGVTKRNEIIIEQYLEGIEFGSQAFVREGQLVFCFYHNDTVSPPPQSTPIGHSMPADLSKTQQQEADILVSKAVRALGIRDCVANVDLIMVKGKPYILEIGARMGATCLPENISIYYNFDVYRYVIELSLGEFTNIKIGKGRPNAALLLQSKKTGVIRDIIIPRWVRYHKDLVELKIDVNIGDKVNKFIVGSDRIGHVVVTGRTAAEAEQTVEMLTEKIEFHVD